MQTVLILTKHFGRYPTDIEVYRVVWGTREEREEIWNNKGLTPRKEDGSQIPSTH